MNLFYRSRHLLAVLAMALAFGLVTADFAEARRGGSFGSRGFRTFQSPPATNTAPRTTAPINRSMTPNSQATQPGTAQRQGAAAQQRPGGFFGGGFAGSMMRGLLVGGLIGLLLGHGLGGMAGFLGLLLQGALLIGGIMLLMRFLRRRQEPAMAGAGAPMNRDMLGGGRDDRPRGAGLGSGLGAGLSGLGLGGGRDVRPPAGTTRGPTDEIGIGQGDLDTFERLLTEIQTAFGAEDYAGLRERTTPEIMSFFAEELGQNASRGVRNEVKDVRLLQGDLAESWREGDTDYATVAMRYESVDALRERESGRVVAGDDTKATEMTEIWTFRRDRADAWKLSAIQEA